MTKLAGRQTLGYVGIYGAAAPPEWFAKLRKDSGQRAESGVYTAGLTNLLMMEQRLGATGTLSAEVQEVTEGRPKALLPPQTSEREDAFQ